MAKNKGNQNSPSLSGKVAWAGIKLLYRIYQLFIVLPIVIVWTIFIALTTTFGCILGNGHFWGYYPGKCWGWFIIRLLLLPVKVEGRSNLEDGHSYVFVANHQGSFDIFLIYGFLRRNFKWMMKQSLRKMPFVGTACHYAHHIFVDKSGPSKIKESYEKARAELQDGMSLMVFPEGARTWTGKMGPFRRGAFMLADELQLPVVPMTINGSFNVLPRMRDGRWVNWHPLTLTIHSPIYPIGKGAENIAATMRDSREAVMGSLAEEYRETSEVSTQTE